MKFVLILTYYVLTPTGNEPVQVPHAMTSAEFNSREACQHAGETFTKSVEAFKLTHTVFFLCVPKGEGQ